MAKLEQEFKLISPKAATDILENHSYEDQRPIRDWHVMRLASNILTGYWRRGSQIEFAVLPSGKMFLADGYHRMWAVVEAGKPAHFSVLYSPVANMAGVKEIYGLHNQNQLPRGTTEIAAMLKDLYNISKTEAKLALAAAACIEVGLRHFTATTDPLIASDPLTKMESVEKWIDELRVLIDLRKTADPRGVALFKNRWVCAVCVLAIHYHKDKGVEFTRRLMKAEAPIGCPTRALHNWAFPTTRAIKRTAMEFLPATCHAFDMFLKGKEIKGNLSVPTTKIGWMTDTPYTVERKTKTEMQKYRESKKSRAPAVHASAHDPKSGIYAY